MDDELHAPWAVTPASADYRAAIAHAIELLEEGQTTRARTFLAGFLRGPLPPPPPADDHEKH